MTDQAASVDQVRQLLEAQQFPEAERFSRQLIREHPAVRGEAMALLGLSLAGLHRLQQSELTARCAVTDYPDLASAHAALGQILYLRRCLPEAIDCFRRALALDPRSSDVRRKLVVALLAAGDLAEAARECTEVLEATPDN